MTIIICSGRTQDSAEGHIHFSSPNLKMNFTKEDNEVDVFMNYDYIMNEHVYYRSSQQKLFKMKN